MPGRAAYRFIFTAALLLLLELSARLAFGFGHPLLYAPEAACGYLPSPNQDLYRLHSHIHINAYGMRSYDIAAVKPAGWRRILFIGDSVTFGPGYVDQEQIFTSRLQAGLTNVQMLNASAPGWAPANEVAFLKEKGTFGADLVVFVLNTQDLTQPFAPLPRNANFPTEEPASAVAEIWQRYLVGRFSHDPGSVAPGDPAIETETPKMLALLSEAKIFAEKHGAGLAVVYSPSAGSDVTEYRAHWEKGVDDLRAWAERERVELLDMGAKYASHPAAEVYFDGIHLRPLGHELVAMEARRKLGAHFGTAN